MCGISGYISRSNSEGKYNDVRDGLERIFHRGPDDIGCQSFGRVTLGHVRLSILDLSDAGHQPMFSECGRYVIVYNGETYNFRELAVEHGILPRTGTDTEVVVDSLLNMARILLRCSTECSHLEFTIWSNNQFGWYAIAWELSLSMLSMTSMA